MQKDQKCEEPTSVSLNLQLRSSPIFLCPSNALVNVAAVKESLIVILLLVYKKNVERPNAQTHNSFEKREEMDKEESDKIWSECSGENYNSAVIVAKKARRIENASDFEDDNFFIFKFLTLVHFT